MRDLAILFLGAFAPDCPGGRNAATSTAGVLFQTNFLDALVESDLPTPEVRCYYPVASFPKHRSLFCFAKSDLLPNGIRVRSLAHINFGALKIVTLGISSAWATFVWGIRNRGRDRVLVSYNLNAPPAYFVGPVCRLLGIKFVPFIGDIYVPGEVTKDTWLRRVEFAAQRRAIPRADGLLVCNKAIIEDFSPTSDYLLIEGGVKESFVASFGSQTHSPPGFHIVFAGQLTELNGVKLLLDAMKLIGDSDVRVTVMGGGSLSHLVQEAADRDSRISFLGLVPVERVMEEYATADLLVNLRATAFQTHRYVFPSKVVECLATGVPLLSTKTGHVESEFGEFVFLLDEQTSQTLAAKIIEIKGMRTEDRLSIGMSAQKHVLRNKTWEAQVRKIERYLRTCVFEGEVAA